MQKIGETIEGQELANEIAEDFERTENAKTSEEQVKILKKWG